MRELTMRDFSYTCTVMRFDQRARSIARQDSTAIQRSLAVPKPSAPPHASRWRAAFRMLSLKFVDVAVCRKLLPWFDDLVHATMLNLIHAPGPFVHSGGVVTTGCPVPRRVARMSLFRGSTLFGFEQSSQVHEHIIMNRETVFTIHDDTRRMTPGDLQHHAHTLGPHAPAHRH